MLPHLILETNLLLVLTGRVCLLLLGLPRRPVYRRLRRDTRALRRRHRRLPVILADRRVDVSAAFELFQREAHRAVGPVTLLEQLVDVDTLFLVVPSDGYVPKELQNDEELRARAWQLLQEVEEELNQGDPDTRSMFYERFKQLN